MNRPSLFTIIFAGFAIAISGIAFFLFQTYRNEKINQEVNSMVRHQLQIISMSNQLMDDMQNLETGYRGYIISGDEDFLEPYKKALIQTPKDINILKIITASDRDKNAIVISLAELIRNKIKYSQSIVSINRQGNKKEVTEMIHSPEEKRLMENIQTIIARLDNDSRNTLNGFYLKSAAIQSKSRRNDAILSILITLSLTLIYVIIIFDLKRREKNKKSLQEASEKIRDLYDYAPSGYITVDTMLNIVGINQTALKWLDYNAEEISKFKNLEKLVSANSVSQLSKLKLNENVANLEIELTGRNSSFPVILDSVAGKNTQGNVVEKRIILTNISERKKTEEENRYLAQLIDQTSDAIISTDKDIMIRSWNKGAEKMYGYTEEEILNKNSSILKSSLSIEERKAILDEIKATGSWHGELYHHRKDGKPIYISTSTTAMTDESGSVTGYVNVVQDITQRKLYEDKLQNFNKELIESVNQKTREITIILERLTDGFASIDKDFNITYLNKEAAKIFGINKSDVLGKNLTTVFSKEDNSIRRAYKKAFETQQSVEIEDYYDYFKRWYYFLIYPSPEGVSFFFRDVTQRKEAELKLIDSEKQYRNLFEYNPLPMYILDTSNSNILDVNTAGVKHYGYPKNEFIGKNMIELLAEDEKGNFPVFTMILNSDKEYAGIWNHIKRDGSRMQVEILSYNTKFNDISGRLIISNDITEKINYENELRNSRDQLRLYSENLEKVREEERTYIAREIHDELGQQMTGLKMDLSWISKRLNTEPARAKEKIAGMLDLVDETVKSIRRIALELRPGMIDDLGLASAIEWQANEFNKRFGIKCNVSSNLNEKLIDKNISIGIFRIFQEALTNVARHANATLVDCSLTSNDTELNLTIADNGTGIPENGEKKITLGLMGMRERALMMKGRITIESKPGEGTKINLVIPIPS